ncbi:MAG: sulfite exporter TauE/SafE family protein [Lentisphaeria bacterium]|nr:sulfite exporter TauE/SafE family protein [Lentisphaeria bacterium]
MKLFISAFVVFCTHLLEAITGFGSSVLALPFLNVTLGLRMAVQMLCVLSWVMALYIVIRSWKDLVWKEFIFIVCYVALGLPVGMWIFDKLPAPILCLILGTFMVAVGIRGEITTAKKDSPTPVTPAKRSFLMKLLLFGGGIIQGAFGSGGPFIVIYSAKALPEKRVFRGTLSMLWLSMNTIRLVSWGITGELWNMELAKCLMWSFPVVIAGILIGDHLHNKVSEHHFKIGVYAVLIISGIFMVVANAMKL